MESSQIRFDWRALVGGFGEPIPKLTREEKARLKALLKESESQGFERGWLIRISLAAGIPVAVRRYKPVDIRDAVGVWGAMPYITKLCTVDHEVAAPEVLEALDTSAIFQQPVEFILAIGRLVRSRDKIRGGVARLNFETSLRVLRIARKLSRPILDTETPCERETFRKNFGLFVDLVFRVTRSCENCETAVAAFEFAAEVQGRLGIHKIQNVLSHQFAKFEYLSSLPSQLVTGVLTKGCITDADFLSSRIALIEDERENFTRKVRSLISEKGATLPLASRLWAEAFLRGTVMSEMGPVSVDVDAEVNLERMATLLLSSWDAREEGEKSRQLYDTFRGICRTGFNLVLEGEPGQLASFDPNLHEVSGRHVLAGEPVTLLRPWVQWVKGSSIRIIVRALASYTN
jgi:hypothetical protein